MAAISQKAWQIFRKAAALTFVQDFTDDEAARIDVIAEELKSYVDAAAQREQDRIDKNTAHPG